MEAYMIRRFLVAAGLAMLVACSGSSPTTPSDGGTSGGGGGGGGSTGGGSTGGQNDGGNGGSSGGGALPLTAAVTVGNISFKSGHNGSINPAVDTIAVGGTVTWTWVSTGTVSHSIQSEGSPSFASSDIKSGNGSTYQLQFSTPGIYQYDCAVHGAAMSGTIVVR
jgi:plastocyanin